MVNLLHVVPDYQITRTVNGVWRRYLYPSGGLYSEFTSHASFGGWPLVQIANGRSPETGRMTTARGVVAIGQRAVGVVAIGQAVRGVVAVGQIAVGVVAIGQAAVGVVFGLGQVATGLVAVGQFGFGAWGLAQWGLGLEPLSHLRKFLP